MRIRLYEQEIDHLNLLPLTFTRPVGKIRIGILTIAEKWQKYLGAEVTNFSFTEFSINDISNIDTDLIIHAGLLPDPEIVSSIKQLQPGQALYDNEFLMAARLHESTQTIKDFTPVPYKESVSKVTYPWDIFRLNGQEIRKDYELVTAERKSHDLNDPHTRIYGKDIFIEEGAQIRASVLNADTGPIYIGKNADIQEGSVIRGPFALCEGSIVNMGTKVRGDSTVGPHSKIGGEVSNSVIFGYSNKGHEGFLGNSVLGEWCNLGADTNTSNLKNNYGPIKMWNYAAERFIDTGLQFCGLIMGDHSKCGINTMFNTGTTIGVSANVFGEGFPRNFIPSFSWGGKGGFMTYRPDKVFETAALVMQRRGKSLGDKERKLLLDIFDQTGKYRNWEKH